MRDNGIELWIADTATGQAKSVTTAPLNAALGTPCEWVGDGGSLLCEFVPANRGAAPTDGVPTGPNIQEHRGGIAPVRTYEDLLASAHDEALFDYYAHQPARVRRRGQRSTHRRRHARAVRDGGAVAGWPVHPRPPRRGVRIRGSCRTRISRRASKCGIARARPVKQIAQLPVADNVPNGGVLPGPRSFQWQPLAPATVVWAEALDNGDPKNKVPHRDKVMTMSAPFTAAPSEMTRTEYRVGNVSWTDARRGAVDRERSPHGGGRAPG